MTIKDLFNGVDKEDVFLSYIRRYQIIEPFDHRFDVKDEVSIYKLFKRNLFNFIDKVQNTASNKQKNNKILFVIDTINYNFEDKQEKIYECFYITKKDLSEVDENTNIYFDNSLKRYTISFNEIENIANIEVAGESIKRYGKEAVCAVICKEMQMFDFGNDTTRKKEFFDSLHCIDTDKDKCVADADFFESLKKELYENLSDDERQYLEEKEKFEENISPLKDKWIDEKYVENNKIMMDFIRTEIKVRKNEPI